MFSQILALFKIVDIHVVIILIEYSLENSNGNLLRNCNLPALIGFIYLFSKSVHFKAPLRKHVDRSGEFVGN